MNRANHKRFTAFKTGRTRHQIPEKREDIQTQANFVNFRAHSIRLKERAQYLKNLQANRVKTEVVLDDIVSHEAYSFIIKVDTFSDLKFLRSAFKFEILNEYSDSSILVSTEDLNFIKFLNKVDGFGAELKRTKMVAYFHDVVCGQGTEEFCQSIVSPGFYNKILTLADEDICTANLTISCDGLFVLPKKPSESLLENDNYEELMQKWNEKYIQTYMDWDALKIERSEILQKFLDHYNGQIVAEKEDYDPNDIHIPTTYDVTISISAVGLKDIINNLPYLAAVSELPQFDIPTEDRVVIPEQAEQTLQILAPADDDPTVAVVDSGIQEAHPLLRQVINAALSYSHVNDINGTADMVGGGGHGTRVAGAVVFGRQIPARGQLQANCRVVNSRVLDAGNFLPAYLGQYQYFKRTIDRIKNHVPNFKIINHSITELRAFNSNSMSSFAERIDQISHAEDVVIVQSAGNLQFNDVNQYYANGLQYPDYLFDQNSRVANPAQSLTALTVGSVASFSFNSQNHSSVAQRDLISAFSRSGFGIWKSIKPEVVDYGGDYAKDTGNPPTVSIQQQVAVDLVRKTPGSLYARDKVGTSFSAPIASKVLANIQKMLPDASGLLYKNLLINSASWPDAVVMSPYENLQLYGYGIVNEAKCLTYSPYRMTYFTPHANKINPGQTQVFKVLIPNELRQQNTRVKVEISLCFTSEPRKTKKKLSRYFACWVDWKVNRIDELENDFLDRVLMLQTPRRNRDHSEDPNWMLGEKNESGQIQNVRRSVGANQKDWAYFDSTLLPEYLLVAVVGHNGWLQDPNSTANYSLVVSIEDVNQLVQFNITD